MDADRLRPSGLRGVVGRRGPSRGYAPDADHSGCDAATDERPSDLPALKLNPATTTIPILMLTIKQEPADEFWASQVGVDAFRNKPVEIPALLATVKRLTESA